MVYSPDSSVNPLKRLSKGRSQREYSPKRTKRKPNKTPPVPGTPNASVLELSIANSCSISEFIEHYYPKPQGVYTGKNGKEYNITTQTSSTLKKGQFVRCFNLIEETSGADYKASSSGWDTKVKEAEMKEEDMKYLLVTEAKQHSPEPAEKQVETKKDSPTEILAFLSFMLSFEEGEPVVYIYEVHLDKSVRGIGLGKYMMQFAEAIGKKVGVTKSMLTVFTRNTNAESFYRMLGYREDVQSPLERRLRGGKVKRPEYFIFSKDLGLDELA